MVLTLTLAGYILVLVVGALTQRLAITALWATIAACALLALLDPAYRNLEQVPLFAAGLFAGVILLVGAHGAARWFAAWHDRRTADKDNASS